MGTGSSVGWREQSPCLRDAQHRPEPGEGWGKRSRVAVLKGKDGQKVSKKLNAIGQTLSLVP